MDTTESKNTVSYGPEMALFRRLVEREIDQETAMKIPALWMWFQAQGYGEKLASKISENDNEKFISSLLEESMAILAILDSSSTTPFSPNLFSTTATLLKPSPVSLSKIFNEYIERVSKGIESLYNELTCNSFNDVEDEIKEIHEEEEVEEEEEEEDEEKEAEKTPKEGDKNGETVSVNPESSIQSTVPAKRKFVLNPFAKEWYPGIQAASEESRCLFLTFSNGYPLTERQIINFFTMKYGRCIERVYIHYPEHRREPPLFGKVIFTVMYIPAVVLAGEGEAKFLVDRRPLWCKKYEPKKNHPAAEDLGN